MWEPAKQLFDEPQHGSLEKSTIHEDVLPIEHGDFPLPCLSMCSFLCRKPTSSRIILKEPKNPDRPPRSPPLPPCCMTQTIMCFFIMITKNTFDRLVFFLVKLILLMAEIRLYNQFIGTSSLPIYPHYLQGLWTSKRRWLALGFQPSTVVRNSFLPLPRDVAGPRCRRSSKAHGHCFLRRKLFFKGTLELFFPPGWSGAIYGALNR